MLEVFGFVVLSIVVVAIFPRTGFVGFQVATAYKFGWIFTTLGSTPFYFVATLFFVLLGIGAFIWDIYNLGALQEHEETTQNCEKAGG